jgi:hypothetical protein
MADKYNPIVDTLVSSPVINLASWNVAYKADGTIGVTVGTDDWRPLIMPGILPDASVFFAQALSGLGAGSCIFNVADMPRIKAFTLRCNFADGLLKISNEFQTPVVGASFPTPNGFIRSGILRSLLQVERITSTNALLSPTAVGSYTFSPALFDSPLACDYPAPRLMANGDIAPITDKGFILTASLAPDTFDASPPLFSTITIDPSFQSKRILVWAEIVVEHTYPISIVLP